MCSFWNLVVMSSTLKRLRFFFSFFFNPFFSSNLLCFAICLHWCSAANPRRFYSASYVRGWWRFLLWFLQKYFATFATICFAFDPIESLKTAVYSDMSQRYNSNVDFSETQTCADPWIFVRGGGGSRSVWQKKLWQRFILFYFFILVLSLFYRSQVVNF